MKDKMKDKRFGELFFLAIAIGTVISAVLYGFNLISEWKVAVLSSSAALFSLAQVFEDWELIEEKTRQIEERLHSIENNVTNKGKCNGDYTKQKKRRILSSSVVFVTAVVTLIVGMAIEKASFNQKDMNIVTLLSFATYSLCMYGKLFFNRKIEPVENLSFRKNQKTTKTKYRE